MHIFDAACLLFFNLHKKNQNNLYFSLLFCCFAFESRLRRIFFLFNFLYLSYFEHTLFPFYALLGDISFELNFINTFFHNFLFFNNIIFSLFKAKTLIYRNIQWLFCRSFNFKQICHCNLSFNSIKWLFRCFSII